ncbi:hypothetical protein OROHE_009534 [Orobanche hederae]
MEIEIVRSFVLVHASLVASVGNWNHNDSVDSSTMTQEKFDFSNLQFDVAINGIFNYYCRCDEPKLDLSVSLPLPSLLLAALLAAATSPPPDLDLAMSVTPSLPLVSTSIKSPPLPHNIDQPPPTTNLLRLQSTTKLQRCNESRQQRTKSRFIFTTLVQIGRSSKFYPPLPIASPAPIPTVRTRPGRPPPAHVALTRVPSATDATHATAATLSLALHAAVVEGGKQFTSDALTLHGLFSIDDGLSHQVGPLIILK